MNDLERLAEALDHLHTAERRMNELEAINENQRAELVAVRHEAAALRKALFDYGEHTEACILSGLDRPCICGLTKIRNTEHPGAALLAELTAARDVVEATRRGFGTEEDIRRAHAFDPVRLTAAIRAYDAARKASVP